jgi:hypothetical protein
MANSPVVAGFFPQSLRELPQLELPPSNLAEQLPELCLLLADERVTYAKVHFDFFVLIEKLGIVTLLNTADWIL